MKTRRKARKKGEVWEVRTRGGSVRVKLLQDAPIIYGKRHECVDRCQWGKHKNRCMADKHNKPVEVLILQGKLGWASIENNLLAGNRVGGTRTDLRLDLTTFLRRIK